MRLLVGAVEQLGHRAAQVESAVGFPGVVARNTMAIEDGLNISGIMDRPRRCLAGLWLRPVGGERQGQGPVIGRGPGPWLVAADTGTAFAGPEIDEGPHPLDFHEILVQGLKEDVAIGRDGERGRTVYPYRHDAVQDLDAQVRVQADGHHLAGRRIVVVIALVDRPGTRNLLHDPQILHGSRSHTVEALVYVGDHDRGLLRSRLIGRRRGPGQDRRRRTWLQRTCLPAGDAGIAIKRYAIAEDVEQVQAVAGGVVPHAFRIAGDQEELAGDGPCSGHRRAGRDRNTTGRRCR